VKVLRIIYEWPPPWLGLAPAPYELTKAQQKLGHEITIMSARWPKAGDQENIMGVKNEFVFREPIPGTITLTSSVLIFFKYLKWRKKNDVDIIHSHGHFAIWVYLYRLFLEKYFPWKKEVQTPLIAHFHNTVKGRQEKLEESGAEIKPISKFLDWPLAAFSDRLAIKSASACIFVSEELKNEAIKHYKADPKKCYVVETGVNTSWFKTIDYVEKAKTKIEIRARPEDKIFLYAGAIVERKNIHLLIDALTFLPDDYKLLLIGEGDEEYVDKINIQILDKEVKHKVIKVGYTPYPQMPIAYQAADLFVIPSTFEGLPKVALEALASGTQVLASGFRLNEDIEGLEYIEVLDAKYIADKIKDMIEHPRQVNIFKVSKSSSWETKANQIEQIYKHVKENYLK
jgi:glycosyltransferase involved in cell wall biosynthesis